MLDQQDDPILRGRLLKLLAEGRLAQGDSARGRELLQASASILRYFGDRELSEEVLSKSAVTGTTLVVGP